MELFTDLDSLEQVIMIAYSLEDGLKDFYLQMSKTVKDHAAISLFNKLSRIEDLHKDRLFSEYVHVTGNKDRDFFETKIQKNILEGGLSTEEYLNLFNTDTESTIEIISLAMSIEAQALDLYTRSANLSNVSTSKEILHRIAKEEKQHLQQLGMMLDAHLENLNG